MQAEIYTKNDCPFCDKAKTILQNRQINFTEISALANKEHLIDRIKKDRGTMPERLTVPQIYLDGRYVGGYTDLVAYFAKIDFDNSDGA